MNSTTARPPNRGIVNHLIHLGMGKGLLVALAIVFITPFISAPPVHATQTIPYKINFQGRLADAGGSSLANGKYNMRLRLMTAASGGTNLWQADRIYNTSAPTDYRVQVTNGMFSIQLGEVTSGVANDPALSPAFFNTATYANLYLEVELSSVATATCSTNGCQSWTEGAMTPRSPLGSAAYAFSADTIDGIDGSSLARNDATNTFTQANTYSATNTYNGLANFNSTTNVANNQILGFNIQGTAGSYTLQAAGTGAYFFSDSIGLHVGVTGQGSGGGSITPGSNNEALVVSNGPAGAAIIRTGVLYGPNLVDNGNFEQGNYGWGNSVYEGTIIHSGFAAGKYVMSVPTSAADITAPFVAAQPGEVYYAEGWLRTTAGTTGTGSVSICFYDKAAVIIGSCTNSTNTNPGTTWTQRTVTSPAAPANTVYMRAKFANAGDGSTAGTWYYDDMYVAKVNHSEPALFQNTANSTTAFQIQNAAGSPLLVADTTNMNLKITAAASQATDLLTIDNTANPSTTAGVDAVSINFKGGNAAVESEGIRVDYQPGTTSGGTWSGLRVVANATGPVSGVTSYGIKLEGPSSPGAGTETGMYIGTGWDTGLDVQSGGLNLAGYTSGGNPADPAASATDNLAVYAKKVAGRMLLKTKGPVGADSALQPALFGSSVMLFAPNSAAVGTGTGFGTVWQSNGTVSHPVPVTTAPAVSNQIHRTRYANIVTTTNQVLGPKVNTTSENQYWMGNAAGLGGFFFNTRFVVDLWPAATVRVFAGLSSSTTGVVASDTVAGDVVGLWHSTVDPASGANSFNLVTRDNTTTNKTSIALSNAIAAGNSYDFSMYAKPNTTTVYYRLDDIVNGVSYEGNTSTNVPRNTIFMGPQVEMSNGTANTVVTTTGIGVARIYAESDR